MPVTAFIGLGANLGDRGAALDVAEASLRSLPQTRLLDVSGRYRSAPVDAAGPDFLNAVAAIETGLRAEVLLSELHQIEAAAGRVRSTVNAPRPLDLDLLLFGEQTFHGPRLIVPHPRMRQRAFVLLPLAEIAPERVEAAWLDAVRDQQIERL